MRNQSSIRGTQRRIVILLLFVCLSVAVCAYAEDTESTGPSTRHTKHASKIVNNEIDVKAPVEVVEIDNLTKNIRQTLDSLQRDMEKILVGIRSVAVRKSTVEAEKQTIEILPIQNDSKDQNIANLSEKIKMLTKQMEDLSMLYKQKASDFKCLSANLNDLDIKRKELLELHAVTGSFKDIDSGNIALNLSSNNDNIDSLHRKIDNVLSGSSTSKAEDERVDTQGTARPELSEKVAVNKKKAISTVKQSTGTIPTWIEDLLSTEGRKIHSEDYGPIVVAERNGVTIMTVTQAFNDKYKNTFAKFIKESYESGNTFYYVLGSIDKTR